MPNLRWINPPTNLRFTTENDEQFFQVAAIQRKMTLALFENPAFSQPLDRPIQYKAHEALLIIVTPPSSSRCTTS